MRSSVKALAVFLLSFVCFMMLSCDNNVYIDDPLNHSHSKKNLIKVSEKAATCKEDGNHTYYYCKIEGCDKWFWDIKGENLIEDHSQVTIPKLLHKDILIHTPAKDATCTEKGNIEYWYCNVCGKYYADEEGNNEINSSDIVINPTGNHSYDENTWATDTNYHWHECTVCQAHKEDIAHTSDQYVYDIDNHWKICTECGTQFAIEGHQWGEWQEHTSGSVTHLIAECSICGAKKTATKPEYLVYDIGIGEARLKALEDTPCGDFYINGEIVGNNASIQVSNAQVTIEFKPFINSNINFSPYCNVIHNGSINQITTGTKDENGNYKVSFTLEDKKEYGVNIQLNTEGGSLGITCYLRLN